MKARPILMGGPMVRALIDGRKKQTRRALKTDHDDIGERDDGSRWPWREDLNNGGDIWYPCPCGRPGDLLWVRETVGFWPAADSDKREDSVIYRATDDDFECRMFDWTPSIFMPRWANRLTLRITDVRVERLHEISDPDIRDEGIAEFGDDNGYHTESGRHYSSCPADAFASLWEPINGPDSWDSNPWVWVVQFDVIRANVDDVIREAG